MEEVSDEEDKVDLSSSASVYGRAKARGEGGTDVVLTRQLKDLPERLERVLSTDRVTLEVPDVIVGRNKDLKGTGGRETSDKGKVGDRQVSVRSPSPCEMNRTNSSVAGWINPIVWSGHINGYEGGRSAGGLKDKGWDAPRRDLGSPPLT